MAKKLLCVIVLMLALVCVLASCGGNSDGSTTEAHTSYDAFAFYPLSSNTYTVTISPEGKYYEEIVIPSTYNGDTVVEIADEGFKDCKNLRHIKLPETITQIGNHAFSGCSSLTSVTIPDSVTSISSSAFYGCSSLTSVTIPDSVTYIGSSAFEDCSSLTSVYYTGSASEWQAIDIDDSNSYLKNATIHYNHSSKD